MAYYGVGVVKEIAIDVYRVRRIGVICGVLECIESNVRTVVL